MEKQARLHVKSFQCGGFHPAPLLAVDIRYEIRLGACMPRGRYAEDLTGVTFGRLTVKGRSKGPPNKAFWNCECECGQSKIIAGSKLRSGWTRSCGCLMSENCSALFTRHGFARKGRITPEFRIWADMRNRCRNPNHKQFSDYGGRGIKVCERWESFENFFSDMGSRPDGLSIDRINNDGDYEPSNCRWATRKQQCNNRRVRRPRSFRIEWNGKTYRVSELAKEVGLKYKTLYMRLIAGWSTEDAIKPPLR